MAFTQIRNDLGVLELGAFALTRGDIVRLEPTVEDLILHIGPTSPGKIAAMLTWIFESPVGGGLRSLQLEDVEEIPETHARVLTSFGSEDISRVRLAWAAAAIRAPQPIQWLSLSDAEVTYRLARTDATTCGELELTIRDLSNSWNLPLRLDRSDWIRRAVIRYRGQTPPHVGSIEELADSIRSGGKIPQVTVES